MCREPPLNPMTLALPGILATVLHCCPSVRPLLTPVPIRSKCPTLLIKFFSIPSHVASSLLASGCILSFFSGLSASGISQGPSTGVWTPAGMDGIAGPLSISGPRVLQQWMLAFLGMINSIWSRYVLGVRLEVGTGRISNSMLINVFCPPGHPGIYLPNKGRLHPSEWLSKAARERIWEPSWNKP